LLQPAPSIESALSAAFPEANASLKKRPGLDADLSGSTGIVALVHQSRLVAANLGDSRCVLGAWGFVEGGWRNDISVLGAAI
jgi:serine/threonine protein phosphatase PrpC